VITKQFAFELSQTRPNEAKATRYKRCIAINQFSLYLSQNGLESAKCIAPKPKKTFVPYIYTTIETDQILKVADTMDCSLIRRDSLRFVMPCLLRFLLCTGVRIGEAIKIEDRDMDIDNRVFILRDTKNGKDRLLPFDESLAKVLRQYKMHRDRCNPNRLTTVFFCSYRGLACQSESIYKIYRFYLVKAGIPFKGNHYGPRVHDLRHTFAVRALKQMVDNGMDIYCTLPILSTYLGHQSLEATNHYVRICTEMYPELVNSMEGVFNNIFPSLTHDFYEDD
jgi:integrase